MYNNNPAFRSQLYTELMASNFSGAGAKMSFDMDGDCILRYKVVSLNQNQNMTNGSMAPGEIRIVGSWSRSEGFKSSSLVVWPGRTTNPPIDPIISMNLGYLEAKGRVGAEQDMKAVNLAFSVLNSNPNILPNTTLAVSLDEYDSSTLISKTSEQCARTGLGYVSAVLGPFGTTNSMDANVILAGLRRPQITYRAAMEKLSSRMSKGWLLRLCVSEGVLSRAIPSTLVSLGWNSFSTIRPGWGNAGVQGMLSTIYHLTQKFGSSHSVALLGEVIIDEAKINALNATAATDYKITTVIPKLNDMVSSSRSTVWVLWVPVWAEVVDAMQLAGILGVSMTIIVYSPSSPKDAKQCRGFLSISPPIQAGYTSWFRQYISNSSIVTVYPGHAYEAAYLYGLAVDKVVREGGDAKAGSLLNAAMRNISFAGVVTPRVSFTPIGELNVEYSLL